MKNQDMNDQEAFNIIVKLALHRATTLIVTGESLKDIVQNNLMYEQLIKEARQLNEMLEYIKERLNVELPKDL